MHAKGYSMANEFKATVVETRAWARRTGDARGRRQLSGGGRRAGATTMPWSKSRYPKRGCNLMYHSENLAAASRRLGRAGLEAPPLRGHKKLTSPWEWGGAAAPAGRLTPAAAFNY